ncbi:MAG: DNA mismatch repair protein MutS [Promethearchaeota archaeon]|jgi:DNA mismatch repair protein MutS
MEEIDPRKLTPMLSHWYSVRKRFPPEYLIAYRMGDFYEFFYDDAKRISKLLGITLTKRGEVPLAGIPHHSGHNYFNNLMHHSQTVVIVDQLEDPATVKGRIVKRGVTRILSPGTIVEPNMLEANKNNYIASMVKERTGIAVAFADISTGEFLAMEYSSKDEGHQEKLLSLFSQYDPAELLIPPDIKQDERFFLILTDLTDAIIKTYDEYVFNYDEAYTLLKRHFKVTNLEGMGLEGKVIAIQAAGGLLAFLKETQRDVVPNIFKINVIQEKNILHLDYITQRNLELVNSLWDKGKDFTLFSVFNHTHTPMGARLLRRIILQPLTDLEQINDRLNIVQKFKDDIFLRSDLREALRILGDLERFINKMNYASRSNARDLVNIKSSLEEIPKIRDLLKKADIPEIAQFVAKIKPFDKIKNLIQISIKKNPPTTIKEGNIIKEGYNIKVDELRDILNNGKKYILDYENEQKKRWKLTSGLKVGFNNILGYYIEITLRTLQTISKIPEDYKERATLKNAKRFTTVKLKELEEKILTAEEQVNILEYEIFNEIRGSVEKETENILETARNIAIIDVLACFAEIAEKYDYCRPIINTDSKITIREGRHPVVEQMDISEKFIPNDCYLDTKADQLLMITGPNMAGKCVQKDTILFSEKGILPIKWFKPKGIEIESFKELNIKLVGLGGITETSHFYSDGLKRSIIIKSKLGYCIEGSINHPILVRTPSGNEIWKKLSEVSKNDYLIINRKNNLWGNQTRIRYHPPKYETGTPIYPYGGIKYDIPTQIDEDLGYLIGLLIGEGKLTYKRSFSFTSKDTFLKKEFYRLVKKLFNYDAKSKKVDRSEHFVSSLYIRDFLYYLGLKYVKAHEKEIPKCLLRAPKRIIIALFQGLFDTDGSADNRYGNVSYSTTSITLATQVHTILLNFGIISSLKPKKTSGRVIYNISLYGEDSIKFYHEIDFRLPRKSGRKNLISEIRMPNIDSIPYLKNLLEIIQNRIVAYSHLIPHNDKLKYNKKIGGIFYSYIRQNRNISFHKLRNLNDYCRKYNIKDDELEKINQNYFFYDKIESIRTSQAELYDFTIPDVHSFIGNGFINHNSTYLRQVALICLIAQMGCFVPANSATIGILDQIFTRIGASDDLARKLSTFMIEMTETAKILNYATPKSLVIIDELGRGTSTSDGQSIAMATLEKLTQLKVKTLFSTHYHQLTEIDLPGVKNFHLDIIENDDGSINFVRKLKPGSTDKSYGIHVAKLAGIPDDVIIRAFEILEKIEKEDPFRTTVKENGNGASSEKYYDKIINGKKVKLEKFNSELEALQEQLEICAEDLTKKERELKKKKSEIEELGEEIKAKKAKIPQTSIAKKRKYVQTSLFETTSAKKVVSDEKLLALVESLKKLDINTLVHEELKEKLERFKKQLENLS